METLNKRKYTKLKIFDFDGTIVHSPLPEDGKILWKMRTRTEWPHKGWWSKPESLDKNVFVIPTIEPVIEAYNEAKSDPDTLVVMMTGRLKKLSREVVAVLNSHGLVFDRYYYNTGGETASIKMRDIEKLLEEFPTIKHLTMFDDRNTHIPIFIAWGRELPIDVMIHHVQEDESIKEISANV